MKEINLLPDADQATKVYRDFSCSLPFVLRPHLHICGQIFLHTRLIVRNMSLYHQSQVVDAMSYTHYQDILLGLPHSGLENHLSSGETSPCLRIWYETGNRAVYSTFDAGIPCRIFSITPEADGP